MILFSLTSNAFAEEILKTPWIYLKKKILYYPQVDIDIIFIDIKCKIGLVFEKQQNKMVCNDYISDSESKSWLAL